MPFFNSDHQRMIEVNCGNAQEISGLCVEAVSFRQG